MKLRRRRKEEGGPTFRALPSPSPPAARARFCSRSCSLLPSSFHSLLLHPAHQPATYPPSLSAATCRRAMSSSYPSPAVPLLPFFFIKLPKQKSVEERTVAGAQLADPAVLLNDNRARPARRTLAPSSNRVPRLLSGSNGILSVAGGAIGKQRPKMNYPVSFPLLMNK